MVYVAGSMSPIVKENLPAYRQTLAMGDALLPIDMKRFAYARFNVIVDAKPKRARSR